MENRYKFVATVLLWVFIAGLFLWKSRQRFYSWTLILVLFSIIIVFYTILKSGGSTIFSLILLIAVSLIWRTSVAIAPYSLVGRDIHRDIRISGNIIENSAFTNSIVPYYGDAPIYQLLPSINSIILDIGLDYAYILYTSIFSILFIIITFIIASVIFDNRIGLISSGLVSVATWTTKYSYQPIPQSYSTIFLYLTLFLIVIYSNHYRKRCKNWEIYILMILFSTISIISHKASGLLLVGTSFLLLIHTMVGESSSIKIPRHIPIVISILTLFQWIYVADFLPAVIAKAALNSSGLSFSLPFSSAGAPTSFPLANQPDGRLFSLTTPRARGSIILLITGFLGGLLLIGNHIIKKMSGCWDHTSSVLLSHSGVIAVFIVLQIFLDNGNMRRFIYFGEISFAILSSVFIIHWNDALNISKLPNINVKSLKYILIVCIVLLSVFSGPSLPDYENKSRIYFDKEEVSSKSFINNYSSGSIAADHLYGNMNIKPYSDQNSMYTTANTHFYNGEIPAQDLIVLRKSVQIIYSPGLGHYALQSNVSELYSNDCNSVYSNSGVSVFSCNEN